MINPICLADRPCTLKVDIVLFHINYDWDYSPNVMGSSLPLDFAKHECILISGEFKCFP